MMKLKYRIIAAFFLIVGSFLGFGIFRQYSDLDQVGGVDVQYDEPKHDGKVHRHPLDVASDNYIHKSPGISETENSWAGLKDRILKHMHMGFGSNVLVDPPSQLLEERKQVDRLLHDEVFENRTNVEAFLKVARALREQKGDVDKPCEQQQEEAIVTNFTISEEARYELESIIDRMEPSHIAVPKTNGKGLGIFATKPDFSLSTWQLFHKRINQFEMYGGDDPVVDRQLHDLANLPIVSMSQAKGGTQIKLMYTFSNKARAIFKPMRFPRDRETLPDHYIWADFERHIAEIAAFHLDRLLGFHRVPPVAGRVINITEHVKGLADSKMLKTVHISPAGNVCFYGQCKYYCDSSHSVCGHPELLEGSLSTYLVTVDSDDLKSWTHPWKRSYSKSRLADWQTDPSYCESVRPLHEKGRILLDLMDMSVFDFLQGNLDRHKYWILKSLGNDSFPLHLDNGRGFGNSRQDYLDVLAPVYQCCLIRYSTLRTLMSFHFGEKLSDRMRRSLTRDALTKEAPILHERHLAALDRRVAIILEAVYKCIQDTWGDAVVVDDGL